jgi:WD40 repeat protein
VNTLCQSIPEFVNKKCENMDIHKFDKIFNNLSNLKKKVLLVFLQNPDKRYKEIAPILNIKEPNFRRNMGYLYRDFKLNEINSGDSDQDKLIKLFKKYKPELLADINDDKETIKDIVIEHPQQDLADIPVSTNFYGRNVEIQSLETSILDNPCKGLIITGIYGVGKTSLAVEFAKRIKDKFHFSMARSLENSPSLKTILTDIIQFLSQRQIQELPTDLTSLISLLIEYLKEYRCLIILDNLETILQSGDRTGQYRQEYQGFRQLFRSIITTQHQSCLLLTSREIPQDISLELGGNSPVQLLRLKGLELEDGKNIIKNKLLIGAEKEFRQLVKRYEGHPSMLKLIIPIIHDIYSSKISIFLESKTTDLDDINNILNWHFQRLSNIEKQVIYWLAINRECVTLEELQQDIKQSTIGKSPISSLKFLVDRSLINQTALGFKLQPVIREYITERLVKQVCAEIATGKLEIFKSHAFMKATAKDHVRESQNNLIVKPIIHELLTVFNTKTQLQAHLKQILSQLRKEQNIGYAGGNLLNILIALEIDLTNYDFSDIKIMQAFLRDVNLHKVNFQNSHFSNAVFKETIAAIFALAFSPDGEILAIGDYRATIQLLNTKTKEKIFTINYQSGHVVRALAFSPDGQILASGSTDGTIQLWDVINKTTIEIISAHDDWVHSLAFTPDGQILASGSGDSKIKLWDVQTRKLVKTLSEHRDCVHSVAFNSQGILASGSRDKTIKLWKIDQKRSFKTFEKHTDSVYAVAFSPDGKLLASGSGDSTVNLWDIEQLQYRITLKEHNNIVFSIAFSADGKTLASGAFDSNIQLWDIQDLENIQHIKTLQEHQNWIRAVAFSPQDHTLASGDIGSIVKLWNLEDINHIDAFTLQGHTSQIRAVAFSPQGNILASASSDKMLRLWNVNRDVNENVNDAEIAETFTGHTDIIYTIAFHPQGTTLASGSADSTIRLWDMKSRQYIKTLQGSENHLRSLAFSSQSHKFASASRDGSVKLWDIDSGKDEILLQEDIHRVDCITFHPHQEFLACGLYNGDVKLWDVTNKQFIETLSGHTQRINSLAFNPQGNILASASNDNTIRLWKIHTDERPAILAKHTNWVRSLAFNLHGNILASGSSDGRIILWDMINYEPIKILEAHSAWVYSIAFSPCGKILASGSADETIKLWDVKEVKTATHWRTLTIPKPYEGMNITGSTGLNAEAKATLKALGAVEFL